MLGELTNDQIEDLLLTEVVGRIGCHSSGLTFVVPITYAYDEGYVYAHSKEGMKIRMMRENPIICFEVDRMRDLSNWQSVVAWGRFEELKGNNQKMGLQKIIRRLRPLMPGETVIPHEDFSEGHQSDPIPYKAVIFRLKLLEKTGRFEKR